MSNDDIKRAQIIAGEQAVVQRLKEKGLIPAPPQPESGAATCGWVKASERLPEKDGWYNLKVLIDGVIYPEGHQYSTEHKMFGGGSDPNVIEWLEELPPSKPQAGEVTVDALGEAAKNFAETIQTKEGTISRLNAISWFGAGAKWAASRSNAVPPSTDQEQEVIWGAPIREKTLTEHWGINALAEDQDDLWEEVKRVIFPTSGSHKDNDLKSKYHITRK